MTAGLTPISFPAYETLRPVTDLSGVILCDNPSEMTFEGTNTVVLRAPGSPTCVVVDPGPEDRAHAERIATIVGEIELVVVTHRHGDHTDGIDHLRAFTSAPVRAVEERFCRDAAPLVTGGDVTGGGATGGGDDEVIHAAGLDITVWGTPGHTADSVSLEVRPAGAGFTARPDCVVLGDTILGRDSTVLDSTDGDLGDYLGSMDLLAARADGVIGIPGHGPDVENTGRAAQVLGQHRRDRLEQIVAARAELGRDASAEAITQHIYRDVSPFLLKVAEQSTTVALRYLDRLDAQA
ncbi:MULTISPECIES: MBL fold metallo-hydrolase [Dietzia]|uniref:MBL fold metallo-hydrolase n=1 Tax=Dietzia TaxID=37914 RepID=UPI000D08BBEC|nr:MULTISPECIES: MBL fold metallo-hydrolase [Dietzia]AVM64431.1 MBL fold metallo-hydrolase [Dietzia sp. oral taxon 368]MCT1713002.1 MBL fold metallo-hydrolase [Dietzia cinnamea]MCT2274737.1 MBL fold metallo-hydrolase [Dietzia cinnamea]